MPAMLAYSTLFVFMVTYVVLILLVVRRWFYKHFFFQVTMGQQCACF